jgi:hypothetical protein
LKDLAYCPICSNHLNNVILSLSLAANTSFVNGGSGDDNDSEHVSGLDTDDSNDEMECDNFGVSRNESIC